MTDHERAWQVFEKLLTESEKIKTYQIKKITGLPFLYLTPESGRSRADMEELLKRTAASAMKGKRLTLAMSFVRKDQASYVYRVRFLVPQRKMFCCGNLCDDCIRFTNPM